MNLFVFLSVFALFKCTASLNCTGNDCYCPQGEVVDRSSWCDGKVDCNDDFDEADETCKFLCDDVNNTIVSRIENGYPAQVCDGQEDCPNGKDEENCQFTRLYNCGDGTQITEHQLCDTVDDCPDGLDEAGCGQICNVSSSTTTTTTTTTTSTAAIQLELLPWYQMYNEGGRIDHFYTVNVEYTDGLEGYGYVKQGIPVYLIGENSNCPEKVRVRGYYDAAGENSWYTTNENEIGTNPHDEMGCCNQTVYCVPEMNQCSATIPIQRYQLTNGGTKTDDYYVAGEQIEIPNYLFVETMCYGWPSPDAVTPTPITIT